LIEIERVFLNNASGEKTNEPKSQACDSRR
jgi:hypothetical protein